MTPKVSIGISFKDPGTYFTLAIQSVFAQTFTDWELILVDDGSTDDSLSFAKLINDDRISVYSDGQSRGLNYRLNQMVELAQAPYFFRMDADDIMHPHRIEKQYYALLQADDNTVIGTYAYVIDQTSHIVGLRPLSINQMKGFSARHSFIHPTVAASTSWFRRNPYSLRIIYHRCQDAELWCRTTSNSRFINLPEPLLYYRESGVFSFSNYIASNLGILSIIQEKYRFPTSQYVYLFLLELTKLLIFFVFNLLRRSDMLVKRRSKKLESDQYESAHQALVKVQQQTFSTHTVCHK